ncbi:putative T7SS-secreted protein [Streptomyces tubercidicus]|uniref:putative T7SS-secreted protein n=1 Tax=Streptomyces tubercidicus TaxID=47759 RepID=UPI0034669B92
MSLAEAIFGYGGGDPYEDNGGFPGLQFNPAPGRMQAVQDLVDELNRAHKDIKAAEDAIRGIHDGACWTGAAAEGFREKTQKLPAMLDAASGSFNTAFKVLKGWNSDLEHLQSKAVEYERQAKEARKRAERAESNPDAGIFGGGERSIEELMSEEQWTRHQSAVAELNAARSHLEQIISNANGLKSNHEELAGLAASSLAAAGEQAPDEPGLLDWLGDMAKGIASLGTDLVNFVKQHANAIAAVGDVLSLVSTTLGAIGVTCDMTGLGIVGGPLGGFATVFAGAALVAHGSAKLAGADVSAATLGWDGLGVITGGIGSAALQDGGKLVQSIPKIIGAERGATGAGVIQTALGLFDNNGALDHFKPKDAGQRLVSPGGVAPLFIALQNAWESGSEKDRGE